jgi:hypothetical protein
MSVWITVRRKDTDNNTGLLRNPATVLEPSPNVDPLEYGRAVCKASRWPAGAGSTRGDGRPNAYICRSRWLAQ